LKGATAAHSASCS